MSDTSTAQPNWHGLSNPLSGKEFVELPLLSSYNNAFLETITEEGSEFEPSEDGSASFEQSDYLPFEPIRVEQATSSLVRVDPSLMIGELDSPDYEEVFPMPIQSFPAFRKDLLDYSNLLIPLTKTKCSEKLSVTQNAGQLTPKQNGGKTFTTDMDNTKNTIQTKAAEGNTTDELIKTSDYQSYDEADLPADEGEDDGWCEGTALDQTPGRSETIKRIGSSNISDHSTLPRVGFDGLFEPLENRLNPFRAWSDEQDTKSEEVLVLSAEGENEKLVWKLEPRNQTFSMSENPLTSSPPTVNDVTPRVPQRTTTHSFPPSPNICENLLNPMECKRPNANGKPTGQGIVTRGNITPDIKTTSSEDTTQITTNNVSDLGTPQTTSVPAVSRPILPRFCDSTSSKSRTMEFDPIPPPKPQFPRHGLPELLFGQSKGLSSSMGVTHMSTPTSTALTRPPLPPRPSVKPVNQNNNPPFQPTLSYREILSTTHATDVTRIPKSQSFHSTFTSQTFQPTYPLVGTSVPQSVTGPGAHPSPMLNSNMETFVNPATSSYLSTRGTPMFNYSTSLQSHTNWLSATHGRLSPHSLPGQTVNGTMENHDDVLIENPAYMSTFIPEYTKRPISKHHTLSNEGNFTSNSLGKGRSNSTSIPSTTNTPLSQTHTTSTDVPSAHSTSRIPSEERGSDQPGTVRKSPPGTSIADSQAKGSPLWIANSTPLAHYYATHSAMAGKNDSGGTWLSSLAKPTISRLPEDRVLLTSDLNDKTKSNPNPRPIQRSFAVVGVSELLAKTDEELNQFMQNTAKQKTRARPELIDELSNESSGNQASSTSGGPIEHSPIRRRFQSSRVGPTMHMRFFDPSEAESDSDQLDRRSFYDYGCDDDDDDDEDVVEEEDLDDNEVNEALSESGLDTIRRGRMGHSIPKAITSAGTEEILRQLRLLNQNTQFVWSDSCPTASNAHDRRSIKELDDMFSQWDMPFIDSDSFLNEPWNNGNNGPEAWRLNYSRKPIRANLDEVTLASDRTSSKVSWGSTNAINYLSFVKPSFAHGGSRELIENEYDDVTPDEERKRHRTRSRRGFHSYDGSKQESRLHKITAPWFQRLCGCVRPSRFRRKESI